MLRRTLLLAICMVVLAAPMAWCVLTPDQYCTFFYGGNINPTAANSAGTGLSFLDQKEVHGTVVYDPAANDQLSFLIVDASGETGFRSFYSLERSGGVEIDQDGATIVARVKTLSDTHYVDENGSHPCGNFGILDPVTAAPYNYGNSACVHWGGANGDIKEIWRSVEATPVTGDADYHVFRLTIKGRLNGMPADANDETWIDNFNAYVLDTPLDGQGGWTGGTPGGLDIVYMTDPVSGLTVMNEPAGSTGHGQVTAMVSGDLVWMETIPVWVAPDPTTHEMSFDCDLYNTATGGGNSWRINVNDPEGTNLASWQGSSVGCNSRINSGVSGGGLTLAAGWNHLKMVFNTTTKMVTCSVTPEGGSTTSAPAIAYWNGAFETIGQVQIQSPWDFQGHNVFYLDNFDVTGAHYTGATGERTITVYKDENPTPIMTTAVGPSDSNDRGIATNLQGFMFGTDETAAMQTIAFDYVSGTNVGAFAPGAEVAVLGKSLLDPTTATATSVAAARQSPAGTTVAINGATVSCPIYDESDNQIGFGVQSADGTAGIRIVHNFLGETPSSVTAGSIVNLVGVTSVSGGEFYVAAPHVEVVTAAAPAVFPKAAAMNNKAAGGGAFFSQPAVSTWSNPHALNVEPFSYADGPLNGKAMWTGDATIDHQTVESGALKLIKGTYIGGVTAIRSSSANMTYTPTATSFKFEFKAKQGALNAGDVRNMWTVIWKQVGGNTIGQWNCFQNKLVAAKGATVLSPDQALTTSYQTFGIEFLPGGGDGVTGLNRTIFSVAGAPVAIQDSGSVVGTPGTIIDIQNVSRNATSPQYIWIDDITLTNMAFPFTLDTPTVGANNVGLFVQLTGKVTAVKTDGLTDDENYFYINDGSGLVDLTAITGLRCKPPSKTGVFSPTVDQNVVVNGVMGVRNGARYLWTYDCTAL